MLWPGTGGRWMASGTGDTVLLRLPAATHEDIGVAALTSHVIPTGEHAPITDDPINNRHLGLLTLHFPNLLSMVRLVVAARPRPSTCSANF